MFFNMGGAEILVIALVALIAIGPEQLPSVMRKVGGFVGQARSITSGLRDEFMSGMDEIKDVADVEKWTGSGSDDDPIVPRGFAENGADTAESGEGESAGDTASGPLERRGGQLGKSDVPAPFSAHKPASAANGASNGTATGNSADAGAIDAEAAAGVESPADGEEP